MGDAFAKYIELMYCMYLYKLFHYTSWHKSAESRLSLLSHEHNHDCIQDNEIAPPPPPPCLCINLL